MTVFRAHKSRRTVLYTSTTEQRTRLFASLSTSIFCPMGELISSREGEKRKEAMHLSSALLSRVSTIELASPLLGWPIFSYHFVDFLPLIQRYTRLGGCFVSSQWPGSRIKWAQVECQTCAQYEWKSDTKMGLGQ